jgi:hypothetical protein
MARTSAPKAMFNLFPVPGAPPRAPRAAEEVLREAGFEVTPAETVLAVMRSAARRKPNPNDVRWVQDGHAMAALRQATGADAVLCGTLSVDRRAGGRTRCRYELRRLPGTELIAWSEVVVSNDDDRSGATLAREGLRPFAALLDSSAVRVAR